MRILRLAVLLFLCSLIPMSLSAQQSAPATPTSGPQSSQAASLLQQSVAAMTGGASVTDVTMVGNVTVTTGGTAAGPTTAEGTITLVATAAGQSQITIVLPSGTWVTTENYATSPRTSSLT